MYNFIVSGIKKNIMKIFQNGLSSCSNGLKPGEDGYEAIWNMYLETLDSFLGAFY